MAKWEGSGLQILYPQFEPGCRLPLIWGYGGMVDTTDLKSVDLNSRESSSLSTPNIVTFFTNIFSARIKRQKNINK